MSVCLSVRHTPVYIQSKRLDISSNFFHRQVDTPFKFSYIKQYGNILTGPLTWPSNTFPGGGMKTCDFRPISRFISEMIRGRAIDTIYFEWYQFQFHWMTSNSYFKVTIFSSDTVLERKYEKKHKHRPKTRNRRRDRRKEIDNNYII